MKKQGLIKKVLKKTLKIVGVTVLAGVVVAGTYAATKEIEYADKNQQMNYLFETCGVNNISFFNRLSTIYKQPEEPIKYYYDGQYSDLCGETTTKVLDKIYGYIGEVNPNYSYEIVESKSSADVVYKIGNLGNRKLGVADINPIDSYIGSNDYEITINYDFITKHAKDSQEDERYYNALLQTVITHETMHTFGFNDLYRSADTYSDSVMLTKTGYGGTVGSAYGESVEVLPQDYAELSVNDYANLIIKTAPVVQKEELPKLAKKISSKIKEYEIKHLDKINKATNAYPHQKIENTLTLTSPILCEKHAEKIPFGENGFKINESEENLIVSIDGSNYNVKIEMEDGKTEECSGVVDRLENNLLVLKNVKTHFRPIDKSDNVDNFDSITYDMIIVKVNDEYLMYTNYIVPSCLVMNELTHQNNLNL